MSLYRALGREAKSRQGEYYCQEFSGAGQPMTTLTTQSTQSDLEALPKVPVTERPQLTPISAPSDQCQFIVFDLETTGLTPHSDICQIAAMKANPHGVESVWSTYLLPARNIEKRAQKTTGLTVDYYHGQKRLCLHGAPVEAQAYEDGIRSFYSYLKEQSSQRQHTVLVGYGSERFDVPVLINSFKRYGISSQDLEGFIAGFTDALYLIRKMRAGGHPSLVKVGLSTSLSNIYCHLFNTQLTDAHNAIADTRALHRILFQSQLNISSTQLLSYSSTLSSSYEVAQYTSTYLSYLNSMKGKLFNYEDKPKLSITRYIATKIAKSGICYDDLAKIYKEEGPIGITVLLTSPCDGATCRVTNDQKIVQAVIQHFQSLD